MAGWVALLRGINLGARNRIPMAGLKATFEAFGAEDVRTYIASGNVVFRHKRRAREALARDLQKAIAADHGVDTPVVLRTFEELRETAGRAPFGDDNAHTYVTFLETAPKALPDLETGDDRMELIGLDLYLHLPNGLAKATLPLPKLDRAVGGTNRNFRTVKKLAEMTHG
jgi:uncharacterized protein (DUF1697 family)